MKSRWSEVVNKIAPFFIYHYMENFIDKNVKIIGNCSIGKGTKILGSSVIENSVIGDNVEIKDSYITESVIENDVKVGPYANLRKGTHILNGVKIGSFVEIKNSTIGNYSKVPHLSYVGDADVGERVNIGCGVIFANYDGKEKRRSKIGNDVFIGCNVNIVAPVSIADRTYICAGTTVTKNTEEGDFVIGRVRQENKKR